MKRLFSIPSIGLILALLFMGKTISAQTYFTTDVKGKGRPMILIHGLYCNGDVWKETVERYRNKYECHIITVAGFGGNQPNLNDHFLKSVKEDLINYITEKRLIKPIIIGHSMGAFLALWAASGAPGLFDKAIAVDGVPFLSALFMPDATSESAKPMAAQTRDGMSIQSPEQIKQSQLASLSSMITSQEKIDRVATIAMKADSKTQAEVVYEMLTTDLRPDMVNIDCPVLVLGAWIAYKNYGATHESVLKKYSDQMGGAKNVKIEITDTAKHFIFYDDPAWFYNQVDSFLNKI